MMLFREDSGANLEVPKNIRYPTSFQAVDIVVWNQYNDLLLLGAKRDKKTGKTLKKKRFIGGFVDPKDSSLEAAAKRELMEEAGLNLEVSRPFYVSSFRVDDPRYRDSEDKIMSAIFLCYYTFGFAKAGDDIAEIYWIDRETILKDYKKIIVKEHWSLVEILAAKNVFSVV